MFPGLCLFLVQNDKYYWVRVNAFRWHAKQGCCLVCDVQRCCVRVHCNKYGGSFQMRWGISLWGGLLCIPRWCCHRRQTLLNPTWPQCSPALLSWPTRPGQQPHHNPLTPWVVWIWKGKYVRARFADSSKGDLDGFAFVLIVMIAFITLQSSLVVSWIVCRFCWNPCGFEFSVLHSFRLARARTVSDLYSVHIRGASLCTQSRGKHHQYNREFSLFSLIRSLSLKAASRGVWGQCEFHEMWLMASKATVFQSTSYLISREGSIMRYFRRAWQDTVTRAGPWQGVNSR